MKRKQFFIIVILNTFTFCNFSESLNHSIPIFMIWESQSSLNEFETDIQIENYLKNLRYHNISAIYLRADNRYYKRIGAIAKKVNMQIFTWIPTMTFSDEAFMEKNKDWYAVNKNNISCVDEPPYVDYYRWLCPNEPSVYEYLLDKYLELANIEGITGIHLDYIRYCDIYLPKGLRENYNLIQDYEMPEFDYCYCHRCREGFEKEYGRDPLKLDNPAIDLSWKNWRLDSIVKLVNKLSMEVKNRTSKLVTAAVFPTPKMSEDMVRQAWGKFEIDAVLPMLYNGFYEEEVDWIGHCVKESFATMEIQKKIYAGVFVSDLTDVNIFNEAIESAINNGANGVSFFTGNKLTQEHYRVLKNYPNNSNQ